jgi:colanic acid/amylovoran biosynthesis protein
MNVLIINQCSTNKGDRAVLYFILRQLKACGVKDVTVSASNPQYWKNKPDFPDVSVQVVPWGWDVSRKINAGYFGKVLHLLFKIKLPRLVYFPAVRKAVVSGDIPSYLEKMINRDFLRALKQADLVISTGGHHLTSIIAKSIKTPQIFDMATTLLYNKPLLLWSQSIGSFSYDCPESEAMITKIIANAARIYVRDTTSQAEIQKLNLGNKQIFQTYESVFGLYDVVKLRQLPSQRPNIMGVSIWTGNKQQQDAWANYVRCFAGLIDHAISRTGCRVRFFPMELQGSDRPCIESIIKAATCKDHCEIVNDFPGTVEHINAVSQCRFFIGHKTHSQIFALVAATPLLAIAYHPKTEDFMAQFGLGDFCVADTVMNSADLTTIFDRLMENLDYISLEQQKTAYRLAREVKKDFAQMLRCYRTNNILAAEFAKTSASG